MCDVLHFLEGIDMNFKKFIMTPPLLCVVLNVNCLPRDVVNGDVRNVNTKMVTDNGFLKFLNGPSVQGNYREFKRGGPLVFSFSEGLKGVSSEELESFLTKKTNEAAYLPFVDWLTAND